jgi:hypothetical protein
MRLNLLLIGLLASSLHAADITLKPGDSIAAALKQAREIRKQEPQRKTPLVIELAPGFYPLAEPLTLSPEDSGAAASPTVIESAGEAIVSGGTPIRQWTVTPDGRWHATLEHPETVGGLYVNDQRRFRPRLPKTGWFHVAGELPPTEPNAKKGYDRFVFENDDIKPEYAGPGVELFAIHTWSATRMPIASVDPATHTVQLTGPTRTLSPWGKYKKGGRYFLDNVRSALSEPGEYFVDTKTGELTYIPKPGETPANTTVIAARLPQLLLITGDKNGQKPVEYVAFRGITFAHTGWTLPPTGHAFPQAEVAVSAAVELIGAQHITFDRCVIRHTGNYALGFEGGCHENTVERCEMVDLGAGGVKIGLSGDTKSWPVGKPSASSDSAAPVSHITVRDCTIAHGGRLHVAAVGVWIGQASHNTIVHNDIFDFYYTAVSAGWTWGYGNSSAHHNEIAFNHMHTLGQHVLSDMGGVYTLGVSPGTTVHDNVIHDVDAVEYGGWGLYTDEGSTGIEMTRNLVYRTKDGGFHQHYGRDNHIHNNIFIDSSEFQFKRTRVEEHNSLTFERNIVYYHTGELFKSNWAKNLVSRANLYWRVPDGKVQFPDKPTPLTLEAWQAKYKQDEGSIVADPLFVAPAHDDYRLKPGSPAEKINFQRWDYMKAGRSTPATLTTKLPPVPHGYAK